MQYIWTNVILRRVSAKTGARLLARGHRAQHVGQPTGEVSSVWDSVGESFESEPKFGEGKKAFLIVVLSSFSCVKFVKSQFSLWFHCNLAWLKYLKRKVLDILRTFFDIYFHSTGQLMWFKFNFPIFLLISRYNICHNVARFVTTQCHCRLPLLQYIPNYILWTLICFSVDVILKMCKRWSCLSMTVSLLFNEWNSLTCLLALLLTGATYCCGRRESARSLDCSIA